MNPQNNNIENNNSFNLSQWALKNKSLTTYLMIVSLLAGLMSFFQLGQNEDPPFTFRVIAIRTFLPGATTQEVSDKLAYKLEETLQKTKQLHKIESYSKPNENLIILALKDSSNPKIVKSIWYDVRRDLQELKDQLPQGTKGPYIIEEFGDTYGTMLAFQSEGLSEFELEKIAERAQQQLLKVADVRKVEIFGKQEQKIYLELTPEQWSTSGINLQTLITTLQNQTAFIPAGQWQQNAQRLPIRVTDELATVEQLKKLPIQVGNNHFLLEQIVKITAGDGIPIKNQIRVNGRKALILGISMQDGGDVIRLGNTLKPVIDKITAQLPLGVTLKTIQNQSIDVKTSVNEFIKVLIEAIVIVLGVSFLSLGLHHDKTKKFGWRLDIRPGIVVGLAIPLVLAVTFIGMNIWGIDLHKISLGALIIALGLLVDDAIIAVEMMIRQLELGKSKWEAATYAYTSTAFPMLTGTLITAIGFLPIAMAKSAAGEYTFSIFAVTCLSLVISWFVAILFTPFLGYFLLKTPEHKANISLNNQVINNQDNHHELYNGKFYNYLRKSIYLCLNHPRKIVLGIFLLFASSILCFRFVEQQFFPNSTRLELMVNITLPEDASILKTDESTKLVENWLLKQPEIQHVTAYIGNGSPRFYLPMNQTFDSHNASELIVMTKSVKQRDALMVRLSNYAKTYWQFMRVRAQLLPNGPPVPYPVQFVVKGDDAKQVRYWGEKVQNVFLQNSHTFNVNNNWNEKVPQLKVVLNESKLRELQLDRKVVSEALQFSLSGIPTGFVRHEHYAQEIIVRGDFAQMKTRDSLLQLPITNIQGKVIYLSDVASIETETAEGVIWHFNRDIAMTVQSDVVEGIQGITVSLELDKTLDELRKQLPPSISIEMTGAVAESSKSQASINAGMPLMMFLIFTLLMIQLKSMKKSLLVFLSAPLGLIGAVMMLIILHAPFGFVSMLGVIALFGMIIRNSVILIDQIEQNREQGLSPAHALEQAVVSRFRPIILTAATAILAMIPLTTSVFWGPMAVAIMGGLILGTLVSDILFIPALYTWWFIKK